MSMPIQIGDIIAIARLALEVYEYGWSENRRADHQYQQFGREVNSLKDQCKLLVQVIQRASLNLQSSVAHPRAVPLWDFRSLFDIIGDLGQTLRECRQLIDDNNRYLYASGNIDAIVWNFHVQPTVDRLRDRLLLHKARIQHALIPFEIDLMMRIQEQITEVHDVVQQINKNLVDMIGVLVPNLHAEIVNRQMRKTRMVQLPSNVRQALESNFQQHPYRPCSFPPLQSMSDAFLLAYNNSTRSFKCGLTTDERTPSISQWICLLKAVFIMEKIRSSKLLDSEPKSSHWHSFIRRLEENLSDECERALIQIRPPSLSSNFPKTYFNIWPEHHSTDLLDIRSPAIIMEQLMTCSLVPLTRTGTRKIRLLRYSASYDERFRLIVMGSDNSAIGRAPENQERFVDFSIRDSHLTPIYALPLVPGSPTRIEMILKVYSENLRLEFKRLKDALKFQHALTGFRTYEYYSCTLPKISVFVEGNSFACPATVQLWVPDRLQGISVPYESIGEINQSRTPSVLQRQSLSSVSDIGFDKLALQLDSMDSLESDMQQEFNLWPNASSNPQSTPQSNQTLFSNLIENSNSTPFSSTESPRQSSLNQFDSGVHASSVSASPAVLKDNVSTRHSLPKTVGKSRQPSITSRTSVSVSVTSTGTSKTSSSSSSDHTVVERNRPGVISNGTLFRQPIKPMMVFFTRDIVTGQLSIITTSIDTETEPNFDRCNCKLTPEELKRDNLPGCDVAAIERNNGRSNLDGRLFGPYLTDADTEWDVLKLAISRRGKVGEFSRAAWPGMRRISMKFPTVEDRKQLVGQPFVIKTIDDENRAVRERQVGYQGEIRIWYRRQKEHFYKEMNALHDQVGKSK